MRLFMGLIMTAGSLLVMEDVLYAAPDALTKSVVSTYDGTAQPYILFVPDEAKSKAVPLLVCLHGWGGSERSWIDYTPVVAKAKEYGFAVAAPHGRGNWFYRQPGEQDVLDTIADVCAQVNIDKSRIALAGHSMGGWGTAYVGLRNADLFCTIMPMSGWAPEELLPNATNLNPFFIHDRDDAIVPVENSRTAAAALVALGQDVYYREEIGYGHASQMIGDNMDRVMRWVLANPKPERVSRVSVATRTPWTHRGERWLRVLSTAKFGDVALAQSELTSDSVQLNLKTHNVGSLALDIAKLPVEVREVVCDGSKFAVAHDWRFAVLTKRGDAWEWTNTNDKPAAAAPTDFVVPAQLAAIETTGSSEALTDAVEELLRDKVNADILLLSDDQFMIPPGGLKRPEQLFDLVIRPDNRLISFRVSGAVLKTIMQSSVMPFSPLTAYPKYRAFSDDATYSVAAPVTALRHTPKDLVFEYLPKDIAGYLALVK